MRDSFNPDVNAIKELHRKVRLQKEAFSKEMYPSIDTRLRRLRNLAAMLLENRKAIQEAFQEDFAYYLPQTTDLEEILRLVHKISNAIHNLESWMCNKRGKNNCKSNQGFASCEVLYQPKGVIGNLAPFNYPLGMGLGPVSEMLAAGNRVIIKPSDLTPAIGGLLQKLTSRYFREDELTVVNGGLNLAVEFSQIQWDHLLYSGSPNIARLVAKEAAKNLVSVTLELSGKCPTIVADDAVNENTLHTIIGAKMLKNGQLCINDDPTFIPRKQIANFVRHAKTVIAQIAASCSSKTTMLTNKYSTCYTHSPKIEEVCDHAPKFISFKDLWHKDLSLAIDPVAAPLKLYGEEVVPVMPIIPYDDINEVIQSINADERSLTIYVFTQDSALSTYILNNTTSRGIGVNTYPLHAALPSLGFDGTGQEGIGRLQGIEGFREFSIHRRITIVKEVHDILPEQVDIIPIIEQAYSKANKDIWSCSAV